MLSKNVSSGQLMTVCITVLCEVELYARQDMVTEVLEKTLPAILAGLSDPVDDVGAVAASALIPAAHTIVSHFPQQVTITLPVNQQYDKITVVSALLRAGALL